jgi:hypothetical protein
MPTLNKFNDFAEQLAKGVHDLSTHDLKVVLTNTAPVATNTVLADIAQISNGGGYVGGVGGGLVLDGEVLSEAAGVAKLVITDEVFTASGGSVGPFRYVVLYNNTPTTPADPLIGWYDYGSSITLLDGESLTIDFDATNGVLTIQ